MSRSKSIRRSGLADTNGQKTARNFIAFFLFISIVALSMSVCSKVSFINSEKYAQIFINEKYVSALYNDVHQYAYDICNECSLPEDSVDEVITYLSIYNIEEAYALGNLTDSPQYTKTTYDDRITELEKNLSDSTNDMITKYKLDTVENQADMVNAFSSKISDYIQSKVEFWYMDKLETISNLGKTVSVVMIVIFSILTVVLALITFSIGNKKYRGLRAVAYSFNASAILQFGFVIAMQIIKQIKTLVIYPTYLCDSVMSFVNSSILYVAVSAFISIGISLIIAVTVWKLKRNEK